MEQCRERPRRPTASSHGELVLPRLLQTRLESRSPGLPSFDSSDRPLCLDPGDSSARSERGRLATAQRRRGLPRGRRCTRPIVRFPPRPYSSWASLQRGSGLAQRGLTRAIPGFTFCALPGIRAANGGLNRERRSACRNASF